MILMLILWSLNYVAGKIALRTIDPVTLACFRLVLAALVMLPIYFARPNRTPLKAADIWPFTYLGFLGVILNQGLFTVGLNFTTSDHSAVIIAIGPVIVLLLARAMKLEVFTAGKILGMAISFVGVLLLETENGSPANSISVRISLSRPAISAFVSVSAMTRRTYHVCVQATHARKRSAAP